MLTTRFVVEVLSVGLTVLSAGIVSGQDYPAKPIRIIAGGVGGSNDFTARLIGPPLSGSLAQPVIVENRGGSFTSAEVVSRAPPDGYTLLVSRSLWMLSLVQKTPFDPVRDFAPITMTSSEPNFLIVTPSLPVKSVKELIALAKARPGELNYSHGVTAIGPIQWGFFKALTGVKMTGVSYKSDSQEIGDLVSGYVQLTFQGGDKVATYVKSGRLRALAVTSLQPTPLAPGLPTVAASVPGFESVQIGGVFAPAKTPAAIIRRLNQELVRVLNQADVKQKFLNTGVEVVTSSPEKFADTIKSEMDRWGKVIKDAGIKVE